MSIYTAFSKHSWKVVKPLLHLLAKSFVSNGIVSLDGESLALLKEVLSCFYFLEMFYSPSLHFLCVLLSPCLTVQKSLIIDDLGYV